jgi:hypothetical protein
LTATVLWDEWVRLIKQATINFVFLFCSLYPNLSLSATKKLEG